MALTEDGEIASLFGSTAGAEDSGGTVKFDGRMRVPPGRYRLKLAVADISGKVGTAEEELIIAALPEDRLATSSLVTTLEMQPFPPSVFAVQTKLTDELVSFHPSGPPDPGPGLPPVQPGRAADCLLQDLQPAGRG